MGYSSRYHVASLAAVFVALAVGILIGAALGSDIVSGTADNLEQDLAEDLDQLRAESSDLEGELEFERSIQSQVYPAIVDGRLTAQTIALVGLGDADTGAFTDDIEAALESTGAELGEVATVREPPDSDALVEALLPDRRPLSREDALRRAAEVAGRSMVGRGPELGDARGVLFSGFSGDSAGIDGVVLVRDARDELSPREAGDIDILESGLIAGIRGAGVRVVAAEAEDADESSVEYFSERGLPTVDNVDRFPGRVALVLALDGADGDFGVKDTADGLLPELVEPPVDEEVGSGAGAGQESGAEDAEARGKRGSAGAD